VSRPTVRTEVDGPVLIVTIDRPEVRNAVDGPTAAALADAFHAFDEDRERSVAILTGADGTFCAGADLKAFDNRVQPDGDAPMGPSRMALSKPLIAAIAGYTVAGGLELALLADMRVVEEDATLGVFSRRWGVPLIDGGTVRLPRLIGLSRALDLILTGRPVSADEALGFGLANRVVPAGESRAAAEALAREIAAFPQACMRTDRASTYASLGLELDEALHGEFERGALVLEAAARGARRFAAGAGRHGAFDDV
jgi:enoyl-CoA hydratase